MMLARKKDVAVRYEKLPALAAQFVLTLRLYWPSTKPPSIFDGTSSPLSL
jgi:hypothetical protein